MEDTTSRNSASNFIQILEKQRDVMIAVSTGGPRISDVNNEYIERQKAIKKVLPQYGIEYPNHYDDLWEWYGKWSSGDLPTYLSRRLFLRDLFSPAITQLEQIAQGNAPVAVNEPTGWTRVDRCVDKMRLELARGKEPEDFQKVGLLGREVLISLSQAVFDQEKHKSPDGITPSETDAKRKLEAYIISELPGKTNDELRAHARASLNLALSLQHDRTADFRTAALCVEGTTSIVNIIAIISGIRDPK